MKKRCNRAPDDVLMTAMVYRAEGKLSAADEVEFLAHWGTAEALAEAREKSSA